TATRGRGIAQSTRGYLRRNGEGASRRAARVDRRDVLRRATTDHRPCSERSTTGVVQPKGVCRCRWVGFLRSEPHRYGPRGGETCRQNPARRQAQGCPRRAAYEVRALDQPEDREGAWPDDPAVVAAARGRGDPVMDRRACLGPRPGGLFFGGAV